MCQSDNSEASASVTIRPMRFGDIEGLVDLWVASWRETKAAIDFDARRGWIAMVLADRAHETLVACHDGPLGFATLQGRTLHQLVVAPRAKGAGAARALLDAAKARAPGGLDLEVNQDNARAVRFYAREGFGRRGAGMNPNSGLATWHLRWPNP